jgi:hypothetical protein
MTLDEAVQLILDGLTTLAIIAVPLVLLWIGNRVANAVKDREIKEKYVELATRILGEVPYAERQDDMRRALRRWATDVVNTYSEIKLPESTQQALVERMPLVEPETPVRIRVADESGGPVSGAHVRLIEHVAGYRTVRTGGWTDRNGEINFGYLRGSWMVPFLVSVNAEGFRDFLSDVAPLTRHHGRVFVLQGEGEG